MKGRLKLTLLSSGGSYSMKLIFWKIRSTKGHEWWITIKAFFSWRRIRLENSPRTKKSIWIENWISVLMHLCIPSSLWISPSNHTLCVPFLFLSACLSSAVLHSESTFFLKSHVFLWGQILLKPHLLSITASLSNWVGIQTAAFPFPCILTGLPAAAVQRSCPWGLENSHQSLVYTRPHNPTCRPLARPSNCTFGWSGGCVHQSNVRCCVFSCLKNNYAPLYFRVIGFKVPAWRLTWQMTVNIKADNCKLLK